MHVVVFGANGKVGTLVVQKLLDQGHSVRAFVHSNRSSQSHRNLEIVEGDVHNPKQIRSAIQSCEAVISTLGSWGTPTKDILTAAMTRIVPAMQEAKITRIISLTGSGAVYSHDSPSVINRLNRYAIRVVASKILQDGENHLSLLRDSDLDWTVVRSPAMSNSTKTSYILDKKAPLPWATISREAVATSMVDLLTDKAWLRAAPYIRSV